MFERDARFSTGYKGNLGKEILVILAIIIGVIGYYSIIYFFLISPIALIIYFYFRGFWEFPLTKKEIKNYEINRKSAKKAIIPSLIIYTILLILLTFLDDNVYGNYSNTIKIKDGEYSNGDPRYEYKYERIISIWNKIDIVKQLTYEIAILEHHLGNRLYPDEIPFEDNRNIIDKYLWEFYPNYIGFEDYFKQGLDDDNKIREALNKRKPMLDFLLKKSNHNENEGNKIIVYQRPLIENDGRMYDTSFRYRSFEDYLFYMGNAEEINDNEYDVKFQRLWTYKSFLNDFPDTHRVSLKIEKLKKYLSFVDKDFSFYWSPKLYEIDYKDNDYYNSLKSKLVEANADTAMVRAIKSILATQELVKENYKGYELAKFVTKEFWKDGSGFIFKFLNIIISLGLGLISGVYFEKKNLVTKKESKDKTEKINKKNKNMSTNNSDISVTKKGLIIWNGMKIEIRKEGKIIKGTSENNENYTSVITKARRLKAWENKKNLQAELKIINGKTIRWKKDYRVNWLLIDK